MKGRAGAGLRHAFMEFLKLVKDLGEERSRPEVSHLFNSVMFIRFQLQNDNFRVHLKLECRSSKL